ncbi:MAG TPA: hypothetical protein VG797_11335 [Phycisphaerales bacterium]|nr:hypothetical protein [Phycisphaerales bacterium]
MTPTFGLVTWKFALLGPSQMAPVSWTAYSPPGGGPWFDFSVSGPRNGYWDVPGWETAPVASELISPLFTVRQLVTTSVTSGALQVREDYVRLNVQFSNPPSVQTMEPIVHFDHIADSIAAAETGELIVIGNGDSNWAAAAWGHRKAMERAFAARFPMRATGLLPLLNGGIGWGYGSAPVQVIDAANSERDQFALDWGLRFSATGVSVLHPGGQPRLNKAGHFASYSFQPGDRAVIAAYNGAAGVIAGSYNILQKIDAHTIVLESSPTSGADLTGGVWLREIIPAGSSSALDVVPQGFTYLNDSSTIASGLPWATLSMVDGGIDPRGPLTVRLHHGLFAQGAGSFTFQGRRLPGYVPLPNGSTINTVTGLTRWTLTDWNIPADPAREGFEFGLLAQSGGAPLQGPFIGSFMQVINPTVTHGFSCHTYYQQGGQSLIDFLLAHRGVTPRQMQYFIRCARRDTATAPKHWLIVIESGGNDRHELLRSAGGMVVGGCLGDTRNAYADNTNGLIDLWSSAILSVFPEDSVRFLLLVTHPHYGPSSDNDDPQITGYRQASYWRANYDPRVAVANLPVLATPTEWRSWYNQGGTDNAHLTTDGFNAIWERLVDWMADSSRAAPR